MSTSLPSRRGRPRSRALPTAALAAGALLVLAGGIPAAQLGPSGRVESTVAVPAPGTVELAQDVLHASEAPLHVSARRDSGSGGVTAVQLVEADAQAYAGKARRVVVHGVNPLTHALDTEEVGDASLPTAITTDSLLADPVTGDELSFDAGDSALPREFLIFPGQVGKPQEADARVTLSWENRAWFYQALIPVVLGLALLALGLRGLLAGRRGDGVVARDGHDTHVARDIRDTHGDRDERGSHVARGGQEERA